MRFIEVRRGTVNNEANGNRRGRRIGLSQSSHASYRGIGRRTAVAVVLAGAIGAASFGACSPDAVTGPGEAATPRMPRAAVVVNEQRVPINPAYLNPCVPQDGLIAFSGYAHTVIGTTIDQNGGVHFEVQVTETSLTGVGIVTGKVYRASNEMHQSASNQGPAPVTVTSVDNFRIIGPGKLDNFYMRMTTHVTVNANGVPTADVENGDTECR